MTSSVTNLSIQSYSDGFIFYESNNERMQTFKLAMEAFVDFPESFEKFVVEKGWSAGMQININITEHGDRFLILPSEIEDPEQIRSFFDFMYAPIKGNSLRSDPLSDGKQQFCYELSSERLASYKRMFTKFKLQNDAFAITEWTLSNAIARQKPVVIANVFKKSMQLFAANTSGILFANSFQIQTIPEVTYFFLRCLEQTGLNPFETDCYICSHNEENDELNDSLRPYIKNLETATFTPQSENIITPNKA